MVDLRVDLAGLTLVNPLVLASGPLSWNGDAIVRAHRAGAAAIVTKTIRRAAARSPRPHIAATPHGVLNTERWSDLESRQWIDREIPRAKDGGATVVASLGLAVDDVVALAEQLERAGADALEVVSYDEAVLPSMVCAAVERVRIPVLAKLGVNGCDLAGTARRCAESGARGITAIDSVGPTLRVDLARRRPVLGADSAWWSGPAILPIALHAVHVVRGAVAVPIVGTGGVADADAAIEMLFAGASAVGLCSAPLVEGLGVFSRMRERMAQRLDELGIASAHDAIGAMERETAAGFAMVLDDAACTHCGACVRVCPYAARQGPGAVEAACRGCGLCVSICPAGALAWERGER
ncbi:MAG: 4Fe-4S binding protein [Candidatus Bipolaricaulota bacterium]|nr:4Fe-4S binding protein [Candidatus Bipolaricaulota bacterium]